MANQQEALEAYATLDGHLTDLRAFLQCYEKERRTKSRSGMTYVLERMGGAAFEDAAQLEEMTRAMIDCLSSADETHAVSLMEKVQSLRASIDINIVVSMSVAPSAAIAKLTAETVRQMLTQCTMIRTACDQLIERSGLNLDAEPTDAMDAAEDARLCAERSAADADETAKALDDRAFLDDTDYGDAEELADDMDAYDYSVAQLGYVARE